jgi:hypothetical protein
MLDRCGCGFGHGSRVPRRGGCRFLQLQRRRRLLHRGRLGLRGHRRRRVGSACGGIAVAAATAAGAAVVIGVAAGRVVARGCSTTVLSGSGMRWTAAAASMPVATTDTRMRPFEALVEVAARR